MLSISKAVLKEEFTLAQRIMTKWQQRLDDGIPGVDLPIADDLQFEMFVRELVGELLVISGKMESLATILADDRAR